MILKESHLKWPRKKDLKQALIQKIMKKKDLVDDKSDGLLNLGNSDDETQMLTCVIHQYSSIQFLIHNNYLL